MIGSFPFRGAALRLALLVLCLLAPQATAQEAPSPARRTAPWSEEVLRTFARLPVQDGGRVKPLDSLAGLKLLTLNGSRRLKLESGESLKALPWLLDCLFFPEQAKGYPCFRVESDAVLTAVGLEAKEKRAWYSYEELLPARAEIHHNGAAYSDIPAKDRSSLQQQTIKLGSDLLQFEELIGGFEPLRQRFAIVGWPALQALHDGRTEIGLAELLSNVEGLQRAIGELDEGDEAAQRTLRELSGGIRAAFFAGERGLAIFPPRDGAIPPGEWWTVSDLARRAFDREPGMEQALGWFSSLEELEDRKSDPGGFQAVLTPLADSIIARATALGEYRHIGLEIALNRSDPFYGALLVYLIAFLVTVFGWVAPRSKLLLGGIWGSVGIATAMAALGITLRCIIRERPPVVSLYDTVLFITATGALFLMVLELFTRIRLALSLASIFGAVGMFLAVRYELHEVTSSGDTMSSVLAVLDSNHYLLVHVVTITIGYMGGLVAALAAHVWIFGRLFGLRRGDEEFYRLLTSLVFGAVCFSLVFSFFGTLYGGKWGNVSWGRFWGWDPKENGALLICLWEALILHARIGGFIRDRGLAVMTVLGAIVITASWWGVNLLSVGLHSYGFTSGIAPYLLTLWGFELVVVGVCLGNGLYERRALAASAEAR